MPALEQLIRARLAPGKESLSVIYNNPEAPSSVDDELNILQSGEIAFRGQIMGGVIAESLEVARPRLAR